jgi:hypothetical protein
MKKFFAERRPHEGLSYDAYRDLWTEQKEASAEGKDKSERKMLHYLNYNWERQRQVHEAYSRSDDLQEAVEAISEPQLWMVLTEPWCGDSSFLLPVIAEAAALNDAVTLRILLRDDNLDIMDQYLTDGSRSIPKLVAFSEDGTELFTWGPRPEGAAKRYAELRETYDDKQQQIAKLVEYYDNGGWKEVDEELTAALHTAVASAA